MMSKVEAYNLVRTMRADGYSDVVAQHVTYDGWQVDATSPAGERVYMPNPGIYEIIRGGGYVVGGHYYARTLEEAQDFANDVFRRGGRLLSIEAA